MKKTAKVKVGVVTDNYKLTKFEEILIANGFNDYKLHKFTEDTTSIKIITTSEKVGHIQKLCEEVEIYFKIRKN